VIILGGEARIVIHGYYSFPDQPLQESSARLFPCLWLGFRLGRSSLRRDVTTHFSLPLLTHSISLLTPPSSTDSIHSRLELDPQPPSYSIPAPSPPSTHPLATSAPQKTLSKSPSQHPNRPYQSPSHKPASTPSGISPRACHERKGWQQVRPRRRSLGFSSTGAKGRATLSSRVVVAVDECRTSIVVFG